MKYVVTIVSVIEAESQKQAEMEAAFMTTCLCQYGAHCLSDVEVEPQ